MLTNSHFDRLRKAPYNFLLVYHHGPRPALKLPSCGGSGVTRYRSRGSGVIAPELLSSTWCWTSMQITRGTALSFIDERLDHALRDP